ncbi:MAG: hypothetical protein H7Z19_10760 [Chitinophagaceae bacterium]|nr:hypothetical protein [Rubrivivax sp.]
MKTSKTLITLALAAMSLTFAAGVAQAQDMADMKFSEIASTKMMDTNKDGNVSRAEFLDTMGKMWDAKAKKMGVKKNMMTSIEFDEIAKYMKAGG